MKKATWIVALAACLGMGAALAGELVPNSLADAEVGEWALYRVPNGYTQKQTVTAREGEGPEAMVTVRIENIYEGEVVNTRDITKDAGELMTEPQPPDEDYVTVGIDKQDYTFQGGTLTAVIVKVERDYDEDDKERTEWWVANEIPVFGIVKIVENDEVKSELLEYGKN